MIMAAGLGTRLRPLTDFLPKPMMPVANRPVLHHLLNLLHRHEIREVGINLHAAPEMIQRYFGDGSALDMEIRWSHEPELLGTAGGTKKLDDYWEGETILVTSGDGLHDIDVTALLGHHRRSDALATLAVKPVPDPSSYGVVILDRDTRVRGFQEKPNRDEARSDHANCAVYVIEPELLDRIPADTFYDFGTQVWPSLVAAGDPVYAYTTMSYWNDIGDLDALRNGILDAVLGYVRIEIAGEEIGPGIWAEDGCRLNAAAQVDAPVVLGRNVVVEAGAQIRGPAVIGADCHVGREAAIRRAALLPGSVVPDEGLAVAGIFGDASKLADSVVRYPASRN
jgi:NDP-sugar pyrophosphorylase family protein